ncbi:MAG: AAA family ATPase [Minisyncoccia bacterium]
MRRRTDIIFGMKKSVYITGIAGSGKTTLTKLMNSLGYEAYDIEDEKYDLFSRIRVDTGEPFLDYDKHDVNKLANSLKIFNLEKLRGLLGNQIKDTAFYFGVANDNEKAIPLFNKSILLRVKRDELEKRLKAREGTTDFANSLEVRQKILGWKDEYENRMIDLGMIVIDVDSNPEETVEKILRIAQS